MIRIARPCQRCVKRDLATTCTDAVRKRAKYLQDIPVDECTVYMLSDSCIWWLTWLNLVFNTSNNNSSSQPTTSSAAAAASSSPAAAVSFNNSMVNSTAGMTKIKYFLVKNVTNPNYSQPIQLLLPHPIHRNCLISHCLISTLDPPPLDWNTGFWVICYKTLYLIWIPQIHQPPLPLQPLQCIYQLLACNKWWPTMAIRLLHPLLPAQLLRRHFTIWHLILKCNTSTNISPLHRCPITVDRPRFQIIRLCWPWNGQVMHLRLPLHLEEERDMGIHLKRHIRE